MYKKKKNLYCGTELSKYTWKLGDQCNGRSSNDVSHTGVEEGCVMSATLKGCRILGHMGPGCVNLKSELHNKCPHARKYKLEKADRAILK